MTGNADVPVGDSALSYQVSTGGAVAINSVKTNVASSAAVKATVATGAAKSCTNLLENEYNRVTTRAGVFNRVAGDVGACRLPPTRRSSVPGEQLAGRPAQDGGPAGAARGAGAPLGRCSWCRPAVSTCMTSLISAAPGLLGRVSDATAFTTTPPPLLGVADEVTAFHGVGLRSHAVVQQRWVRPRLGQPPPDGGRRGQRAAFYGAPPPVAWATPPRPKTVARGTGSPAAEHLGGPVPPPRWHWFGVA